MPGLGPLTLDAILARDLHVVVAVVLLTAICMLVANLLADLALVALDPRIDGVSSRVSSGAPGERS